METPVNLRSLDSLRGLLSVYVLAGHARWLLWIGWDAWRQQPHATFVTALAAGSAVLRYGHEAVMVFFVLSGFFIHFRAAHDLAKAEPPRGFDVADFFRRRARRLVPPYLFALLLTVCLDAAGRWLYAPLYSGTTGDALLDGNIGRGGFTMASILPALCLLPGSAGRPFGSNGPLWSLAFEVIYYLLYPLWLGLRQSGGATAAYGSGTVLCVVSLAMPTMRTGFVGSVLAHYPVWLAGAALVELIARHRWPRWCLPMAAALAVVFFAGSQRLGALPGAVLLLYALGGTAAVFCFARLPARCSEWHLSRLTELLGLCSYTIYICHFPFVALACAAVFHAFGQRPSGGGMAVGGGLAAVLLCSLCFLLCEQPFLTNRRRLSLQPSAAAT